MKRMFFICLAGAVGLGGSLAAWADLTYQPRNPSFGGDANYGMQQMERASAQDSTESPVASRRPMRSDADQIRRQLERAVTSDLTSALRDEDYFVDEDGELAPGAEFETDSYGIRVSDDENRVILEDYMTGDTTEIQY